MAGLSGLTGSGTGGDFKAQSAPIINPVTLKQTNTAYDQTQNGLAQQQAFVNALNAQNGLGNQSNVFNQLQGVTNGTGPNPAQAMLANSTGQNIANQAALMAGQRGAGANAGLLARQQAMNGANIQQQAAGQGAALQAQQSLNALNQQGAIAGQQAQQAQTGLNSYNQAAGQQQQNLLAGVGAENTANVANTSQQNNVNSQIAQGNQQGQQNIMGNLLGAAGTVVGGIYGGPVGAGLGSQLGSMVGGAASGGGSSGHFAGNSSSDYTSLAEGGAVKPGPQSRVGQHLAMMAKGGKVPALVSPGEKYLSPNAVKKVEQGANPMKAGETIPGKPKVAGAKNDYANDTVKKTLDEGGIILPRSVTQSKNKDAAAQKFVAAILAKKGK